MFASHCTQEKLRNPECLLAPAQVNPSASSGSHPGAPAASPQEIPTPPRLCPDPCWMKMFDKHVPTTAIIFIPI